jgi:hypothetical protein
MFLFTWPIDLANSGLMPFQVPFAIYILLGWGFIFASLIMTWLTLGKDAVIMRVSVKSITEYAGKRSQGRKMRW